MKHIKPTTINTPSHCQEKAEPENGKVFRIKSRKPTLRAPEQEKPSLPSIILAKNPTNFKANFMTVLGRSAKNPERKKTLRPKIPLRKMQKRKSLSCPVET